MKKSTWICQVEGTEPEIIQVYEAESLPMTSRSLNHLRIRVLESSVRWFDLFRCRSRALCWETIGSHNWGDTEAQKHQGR